MGEIFTICAFLHITKCKKQSSLTYLKSLWHSFLFEKANCMWVLFYYSFSSFQALF